MLRGGRSGQAESGAGAYGKVHKWERSGGRTWGRRGISGATVNVQHNEGRGEDGESINSKGNDGGWGGVGGFWVWCDDGQVDLQEGTHKETPRPIVLIVDRAAGLLTEAGVGFGMVKVELMEVEVLELVYGEAQFPRDVSPPDRKGVVVCSDEGHGVVVK